MNRNNIKFLFLAAITVALILPDIAHASNAISDFNDPFEKVVGTITGPVGRWIAIFAMATSGGMLIWKREDPMGGFKMLLSVVFGISFIAFAANIVDSLFSFTGALI